MLLNDSALPSADSHEDLFEIAFKQAAIGMAIVSPKGRWLKVNEALLEILGYAEGELLGTTFQAITHPEDLAADLGCVTQILEGSIRSYQMEKRYFHKSGRTVHVLLSVSLVRFADGRPKYFLSQIEDVTARVLAQRALEVTNQRLESALKEVRELRGILPMCSYCKSIRNDKQYWQCVEHYLLENSHAQLSHGVCPDCLNKVFGELRAGLEKGRE